MLYVAVMIAILHPLPTPKPPNSTQPMDQTTKNVDASPDGASALVLVEASQLPGGCGGKDPESPVCAKVTVLGRTRPVPDEGVEEAVAMLVARHPEMGACWLGGLGGWLGVAGVLGAWRGGEEAALRFSRRAARVTKRQWGVPLSLSNGAAGGFVQNHARRSNIVHIDRHRSPRS